MSTSRFMGRNEIQSILEEVQELSKRLESLEIIDQNLQAQSIVPALNLLSDKLSNHTKNHQDITQSVLPAITLLNERLVEHIASHPDMRDSLIHALATLDDKFKSVNNIKLLSEDPTDPIEGKTWILRGSDPESYQLCVKGSETIFRVDLT